MHARLPGLGTALAALAFHAHPAAAASGGAPFLQTLATFSGPGIGWHPQGTQLAADAAGAVYGTTARTGIVEATVWKLTPPAAAGGSYQLTTLHSFSGNPSTLKSYTDDCQPITGVSWDLTGNLVGLISHCNTLEDDMPSSAVFKLSMNQQFGFIDLIGKDYTLYDSKIGNIPWRGYGYTTATDLTSHVIVASNDSNYANVDYILDLGSANYLFPISAEDLGLNYIARDKSTNVLFATSWGTGRTYPDGYGQPPSYWGDGGLFTVMPAGDFPTRVASFAGYLGHPNGVTPDGSGGAYVTTTGNEFSARPGVPVSYGAIWHWTPAKGLQIVRILDTIDGGAPMPGLVRDQAGNFWGVTSGYNTIPPLQAGPHYHGWIFKIDAADHYTGVHQLAGGPEGMSPGTAMVLGAGGYIFGTTWDGGPAAFNTGAVFRFKP
jgi:hypothetical protein